MTVGNVPGRLRSAWPYGEPDERRAYVDHLVQAILSEPREGIKRLYLPLVSHQ